ncbi:MAG: hypothetical protein QF552_05645 [Litorilituus sp.]|jgi:hypothetical protein|nr:hypothetical protein [Litorilituus sp.]
MQFSAHGSYSIERENNILLIDAQGPFNEITAKKYHQDIEIYTKQMSNIPWGSLISFKGNGVFTPDAEQNLIDTTRFRIQNGMVAIAAVITNSPYADILQMQLQRIYQTCCIQFNFFSDQDNAKLWLDSFIETYAKNTANI